MEDLSKEFKSHRYAGVYWRELNGKDRSYFLRVRIDGKMRRIPIGKKSEGITEAFCNQEKARILNAHRFGDDTALELQKVKQKDPTFEELLNWYIEKRELKASTIAQLRVLHSVPFYKSRKVTRVDIQDYIDEMAQDLRPATIALRFRQIRAVFRHAIDREKYKYADPTKGIDLPKGTGSRKRYLTAEEVERLLAAVKDDSRLYLFVKMSLCTGARIGTIVSVHSDDIEPDGTVTLTNHKIDGRKYTGFFDAETMALLKDKKGYVLALPGKEDRVPSIRSIQYKILAIMDELFNPPGTPLEERAVVHSLRHSCATKLLENGVPIEVVSKVLDHSDISVTMNVYGKITKKCIREAVKNIWD